MNEKEIFWKLLIEIKDSLKIIIVGIGMILGLLIGNLIWK